MTRLGILGVRVRESCVDFIFHSAWSGEGEWKKQPQITDLHTDVSKLGNEPVMIERNPRRQLFYVKWGLTRYWQAASYFMPPLTRNCGGPCIKNGERGDWHGSQAHSQSPGSRRKQLVGFCSLQSSLLHAEAECVTGFVRAW